MITPSFCTVGHLAHSITWYYLPSDIIQLTVDLQKAAMLAVQEPAGAVWLSVCGFPSHRTLNVVFPTGITFTFEAAYVLVESMVALPASYK